MGLFRRTPSLPADDKTTDDTGETASVADNTVAEVTAVELTGEQHQWIKDGLDELDEHGVDHTDAGALQAYNDAQFAAWTLAGASGEDPHPTINRIACGVGANLITRTGLEWKLVTDAYGTGIALYGDPGQVVVDPFSLIRKRWERDETEFLVALLDQVTGSVGTVREQ